MRYKTLVGISEIAIGVAYFRGVALAVFPLHQKPEARKDSQSPGP